MKKRKITQICFVLGLFTALTMLPAKLSAQNMQFSLHADPLLSWFSSDTKETVNSGLRPGFSIGLAFDSYFDENYAFSTGLFLVNAAGRVNYSDTIDLEFKWNDNMQENGDIMDFYINGDTAPGGRFNFVYTEPSN